MMKRSENKLQKELHWLKSLLIRLKRFQDWTLNLQKHLHRSLGYLDQQLPSSPLHTMHKVWQGFWRMSQEQNNCCREVVHPKEAVNHKPQTFKAFSKVFHRYHLHCHKSADLSREYLWPKGTFHAHKQESETPKECPLWNNAIWIRWNYQYTN